ncbi:MAG: hypothetical protein ACYC27_17185 [Armatimonadota bacterium]
MKDIMKNNKGISLLEIIVTVGLLSMVIIGTLSVFTLSLGLWTDGSIRTSKNMYASIAIRKLALQIEEGRSATINADANKLSVTFPYRASATSDYDVNQTGVTYNYYLSGPNGTETTGTYLWRSTGTAGTNKVRLARNIIMLDFSSTTSKLVTIKLEGYDNNDIEDDKPFEIYLRIKLRNS